MHSNLLQQIKCTRKTLKTISSIYQGQAMKCSFVVGAFGLTICKTKGNKELPDFHIIAKLPIFKLLIAAISAGTITVISLVPFMLAFTI